MTCHLVKKCAVSHGAPGAAEVAELIQDVEIDVHRVLRLDGWLRELRRCHAGIENSWLDEWNCGIAKCSTHWAQKLALFQIETQHFATSQSADSLPILFFFDQIFEVSNKD